MINRVEYLALKARIEEELRNINRLESALKKLALFPTIKTNSINGLPLNDEISCRIIGSYLHDYYCGLERIFVHVAKSFGQSLPTGNQWHKELLDEMTLSIPGVRTALLSKKALVKIDELRGFRHVFRNAYGFSIDPVREQILLNSLPEISKSVKNEISVFCKQMDAIILS